ncbi:MAG: phosphatidate cytidylyltransferase [Endomicrobium sp.]|nr:phosphatidate cytidylyltransferase [Endomicrobium sp.]
MINNIKSEFIIRILTSIVGIPIMMFMICYNVVSFYIIMFVISFTCVAECLIILKKYNPYFLISLIMSSINFLFLCFFVNKIIFLYIAIYFFLFIIEFFKKNTEFCIERLSVSFFVIFFIPISLVHIVYIYNLQNGLNFVILLFVVIWVLDTASYIFGMLFGKHKLSGISPKKSIEGSIAGIIFGIITMFICKYIFIKNNINFFKLFTLGFVISIISQFSDLSESLIKRDGYVKNSSTLIPGHGGMFDRFDSFIFAAPAMYYILLVFI